MNNILIINASPRNERSQSRKLTQFFKEKWQEKFPEAVFTFRETGLVALPPVDESWIISAFIEPDDRNLMNQKGVRLSDVLVDELKQNDVYVIGVPMYNWSIPAGLKAYIDQIMRINETWKFRSGKPDGDYVGLLNNKKLFILSSRGDTGFEENEVNAHMNFQTAYLKSIFKVMGVTDTTVISLDNEEFGGILFEESKKKAYQNIEKVINETMLQLSN